MSLWKDVQLSLRTMRKSPRMTIAVLATLGLSIGANAAVSVVWPVIAHLTGGDHPGCLDALGVSANYFNILGTQPQLAGCLIRETSPMDLQTYRPGYRIA